MNVANERSRSYWMDTVSLAPAGRLTADEYADVAIVGAGIAGLSAAYELAVHGRTVVVLDRGAIGGGMTARTTAHLASAMDDFFHELIRGRGLEAARLWFDSQSCAISRIEQAQRAERIDCDFARVDGYLFGAAEGDRALLERELAAARGVGMDVRWQEQTRVGGAGFGPCLCFSGQARVHPLKYLNGLLAAIRRCGGKAFGDSAVVSVEEGDGCVTVTTEHGPAVRAGAAIIATNSPIANRVALHSKQAPYRTYAIAGPVGKGAIADALYWDTADPYHYVRLQPDKASGHDVLIIGGEDHKTGEADDAWERFDRLEDYARRLFPEFATISHRWSGQVLEPVDGVGFIGRNPGNHNVYVATGDSGQGITTGVVAGMLLRDLILQRENRWAPLYDPARTAAAAPLDYVRENVSMVENLAGYVLPGELASADELRPGQGAVIREGLKKLAVYRAEDGALHVRSASCTHLGCLLSWNSFERCWDCTCHGSQFAVDGEVLNGPAISPLSEVELAAAPAARRKSDA